MGKLMKCAIYVIRDFGIENSNFLVQIRTSEHPPCGTVRTVRSLLYGNLYQTFIVVNIIEFMFI
jgi:hypothetical protein